MSWKRQKGDGLHVHELRIQRRQWFLRYDTCIGLAYTPRKYHEAPTYVRITERRCVMCMDRDLQRRTDVLVINVARSEARTCPTSAAWPRPHSRLHGLKTHLFKRAYIWLLPPRTTEEWTYLLTYCVLPQLLTPKDQSGPRRAITNGAFHWHTKQNKLESAIADKSRDGQSRSPDDSTGHVWFTIREL